MASGVAGGDDLSEVEDDDAIAHRHDQVHVVLDEEHGHALGQAADPRAQRVHLALGQPAGGLVEQEELRLGHEGAGQRGALLYRVGQGGREPAGVVGRAELVEDLQGAGRDPPLLPARPPQPEEGGPQVAAEHRFGAEHHVLVHGQPGAQPDALEGARDPEPGQVVRMVPAQDGVAVADGARARMDEAADDVEQGRLARAVGPDDADDLTAADRHRHLDEGQEATEPDADLIDDEEGCRPRCALAGSAGSVEASMIRATAGTYPGWGAVRISPGRAPTSSHAYQPPGIDRDVTTFDTSAPRELQWSDAGLKGR